MPALAHELARLIGPFHGVSLRWSRRNAGCFGWCAPARSSANARGRRCRIGAAYKGQGLVSSMRRDARAGSRRFIFRLIYQLHRAGIGAGWGRHLRFRGDIRRCHAEAGSHPPQILRFSGPAPTPSSGRNCR
jgi:hypothetical protein